MAARFKALRNDGICAVLFKPLGFLHRGGGRPNLNAPCFELLHPFGFGQPKVKAHNGRFELAHQRQAFLAEGRAAWARSHRQRINAV